ncbi:BPSS1187 family protein [Humibacter ginsenosidimutans]|uniref:Alpha/beta hydrolase n=1 Tax=Humibacter ginsenosidimutans TaxID=2599293 RepID=A0A5B8M0K2_9MICO|nr:hypothetical protein [Humibacter ginsenosidimutans]QDZ13561.1 hypothetical protein FPZ11_00955 [Humibacter ginsenosidimutans]
MRSRSALWPTVVGAIVLLAAALTSGATPLPRALTASDGSGQAAVDATGTPKHDGTVLSFTLPYLEHRVNDPNAQEIAQHAAGDGPLLLFLPATGEVPNDYRDYLATAVSAGYSVLGLDYWNVGLSVTRTCRADPQCYSDLQRNRFNGASPSRFSRVGIHNSILRRYRAAIGYLEQQDPTGYWGRYLDDGQPVWRNIVLAGHSQGGGESAFIAHLHRVRGVLMYSSPVDTYHGVPAAWMSTPGATPASRMYGFDDVHDMYFSRITGSWRRLGMGTPNARTATAVPTGSHVLLSSLDVGTPKESHGHTVNDYGPRTASGTMVFAPTWRWMLDQVR